MRKHITLFGSLLVLFSKGLAESSVDVVNGHDAKPDEFPYQAIGNHGEEITMKKRVCIIGAGPAGITSAKQISKLNDFEPVVFEKNSDIGGQWLYSEKTTDKYGLPVDSGVYKYLRVNFPKQLLTFPDYQEFDGENRSYVSHDYFFEYFKNYTDHFDIRRFIQFDTLVEEVEFRNDTNNWKVKINKLNTVTRSEISCEAVMVCSGIFWDPNIPQISGIENFSGRVLHSHDYRRPEDFSNQTVAILGASISGLDITSDLYRSAKKIYLSHRHKKLTVELPANLEQVVGVVAADNNQLILSDGSKINADSLILCTGYLYDYPFLNSNSGIEIDSGRYVHPLYKQSLNIEHPTMAFISLPNRGPYIQFAYVQAHYFAALLQGKVKLPPRSEMLKESKLPKGVPKKKAHDLSANYFEYYKELAEASDAEPLPYYFPKALKIAGKNAVEIPMTFKDKNLYLHPDGSIELV